MEGYVYILTNQAMPGLLKIGSTKRSPEERKRELSKPTGVPIEFNIEYEIFSSEMKQLEDYIHNILEQHRFNRAREFFEFDLFNAIDLLHKKAEEIRLDSEFKSNGVNELFEAYEAIEILGRLKTVYPEMIREEIRSVRVYQTKIRCYLEITEEEIKYMERPVPLIDQKIHRQDLGYIIAGYDIDNDYLLFNPVSSVSANARLFIEEFDDYSKLVCCSELFTDKASDKIQELYLRNKK